MAKEQSILPVPTEAEAEAAAPAVSGTVITPADLLKREEGNIKRNFRKFEAVQQSVARSLNVIYYNNLWHLHKTADGKRRYTNFNDYLATEFGWDKTAARARQIMKGDMPEAIAAGDIPAEAGDKRRDRAAPEVTASKAAKITAKQLQGVLDAFTTRLDTVESGDGLARLGTIFDDAKIAIEGIIANLGDLVADLDAEAESADEADEATDAA